MGNIIQVIALPLIGQKLNCYLWRKKKKEDLGVGLVTVIYNKLTIEQYLTWKGK